MKNLLVISNYNSYYVHTRFMNYITNKTKNYTIEVARSYASFTYQLNQIIVTSINFIGI